MLCKCNEAACSNQHESSEMDISSPNTTRISSLKIYLSRGGIPEVYRMVTTSARKHTGGWICKTTQHLALTTDGQFANPL
jgi:hypothetical protein